VLIDRVAALVVAREIAGRAQKTENLRSRPDVSISGFPFLTQVVTGNYHKVDVTVHDLQRDGPRLERLSAHLSGVKVPLGDVVRGDVSRVPVDHGTASVLVTYADLNAFLAGQRLPARVAADGGEIRVTGTVRVLGTSFGLSGTARLGVAADTITVTPTRLVTAAGRLPSAVEQPAIRLLTVRFSVRGLPFGVHLTEAKVRPDGLELAATGQDIVLERSDARPATGRE
jgi:hypothetical protein